MDRQQLENMIEMEWRRVTAQRRPDLEEQARAILEEMEAVVTVEIPGGADAVVEAFDRLGMEEQVADAVRAAAPDADERELAFAVEAAGTALSTELADAAIADRVRRLSGR